MADDLVHVRDEFLRRAAQARRIRTEYQLEEADWWVEDALERAWLHAAADITHILEDSERADHDHK